jgi:hypothetical protein
MWPLPPRRVRCTEPPAPMMHTPHRGVATTVVAGVSPAQVRRHCSRHGCLYVRRRAPTMAGGDTSLRDVPTVHLSPITRGSGTGSRPRSRTPSRGRHGPRCGCWPWSTCGCCRSGRSNRSSRCCRWGSCRRWCYCRCRTTARHRGWPRCRLWAGRIGADAHVINVLLVLASVRIEIERGSVGDVTACLVGNEGDVIADLILVRPAFLRVKRIAHRHVRRPRDTRVSAVGVE